MNPSTRYAIYLAPSAESDLWRFGSTVLGRDAASGEALLGFAPDGYEADDWRARCAEPRRYGFHATIKAPFRLNSAATIDELESRIVGLARRIRPFDAGALRVATLPAGAGRAFVALRPEKRSADMTRLEATVVRGLDPLRAPLSGEQIARRAPDRLSPRQRYYLEAWGYPYVLDEFRLHFTLTGALTDHAPVAEGLRAEFEKRVASPNLRVEALTLFVQAASGEDFSLARRFPLGEPSSSSISTDITSI